jgi:phosphohistidine phosphatase
MRLYLVRHGEAGDSTTWQGEDALRPMTEEGFKEVKKVGKVLAALGAVPEVIITSPLVRARQTADTLAKKLNVPVEEDERLAPGCDLGKLAGVLAKYGSARAVMVTGHNPDFAEMAGDLISVSQAPAQVAMKKGACVCVDISVPHRSHATLAGHGVLEWLLTPGMARALSH